MSFKFIDMFAGIGGIRIPFGELGGQCVFSSEIDTFARQTYKDNFNEEQHKDITQIEAKDIPAFDVLLAGFPCQAFSILGKRKGFEDTRGTLFFDIARILEYHKPKAFLLENVKNLKHHDRGNTLKVILESLQELGYNVHTKVINAKHYIPQNRERIYIVGFKDEVDFKFPEPPKQRLYEFKDVFSDKVDDKYTLSDVAWEGLKSRKQHHIEKGNGFGYTLFTKDSEYSYTLTKSTKNYFVFHQDGKNPRRFTPRECLKLQGFPDSFKTSVSDTQLYNQAGNSVAVPVIRAIATEMVKFL